MLKGTQKRIILHIDMNAFFATCEQLEHPELRGKPIAIGTKHSRSVISTASYEARAYGVRAAMPPYMALKLCPNLIFVEPHFDLYMKYSERFMKILYAKTQKIQVGSIDECYMDATEWIDPTSDPIAQVKMLQDEIRESTGLPCSIGVAPNMLLAKMASDMKKPNGITVLRIKDCPEKMWPLPVGALFGIGKKTAKRLMDEGIMTIGEIATAEQGSKVSELLGNSFLHFKRWANGHDDAEVQPESDAAKSIGNSTTLPQNTTNYDEIKSVISWLSKSVSQRAVEAKMIGKTVQITLKYDDFSVNTRAKRLSENTNSFDLIYAHAMALIDRHYNGQKPIRLLGVALQQLVAIDDYFTQATLFDTPRQPLPQKIQSVLDQINQKWGAQTINTTTDLKRKGRKSHGN